MTDSFSNTYEEKKKKEKKRGELSLGHIQMNKITWKIFHVNHNFKIIQKIKIENILLMIIFGIEQGMENPAPKHCWWKNKIVHAFYRMIW